MFCLNDTMRYFLCPGRTDMRKGISSLCGVVHERMGCSVKNGDVFIFIGSSRKLMKLLHAEDGGLVMYVKGLEAGRFKIPVLDKASHKTNKEYLWMVRAVVQRLVLFHYNNGSRSGTVIEELTKGYKGYF